MFWRKKKQPTLTEQAVAAADRVAGEIQDLWEERGHALSCFRDTANWLAEINDELGEKAALCGSLIAQLTRAQESISKQCEENDKVRGKILDIIGD